MPRANLLRRRRGNMLTMTALCTALIVLVCAVAFGFYLLLSQHHKGQGQTDKVAMDLGKALNEGDRVGQMNNLIARSRELVYVSRQAQNRVEQQQLFYWQALANRLTDEARSSAVLVENERQNQVDMSRKTIRKMAEKYNLNSKTGATLVLPWWESYDSQIYEVSCGYIRNVDCNVLNSDVFADLRDFDKHQNYFDERSNLYKGNINAKLPAPDNDLDFKLCSLPPPVDNVVAPARLVNQEVYKPTAIIMDNKEFKAQKIEQIPSAVRLVTHMDVTVQANKETVGIGSDAAASGAMPPP